MRAVASRSLLGRTAPSRPCLTPDKRSSPPTGAISDGMKASCARRGVSTSTPPVSSDWLSILPSSSPAVWVSKSAGWAAGSSEQQLVAAGAGQRWRDTILGYGVTFITPQVHDSLKQGNALRQLQAVLPPRSTWPNCIWLQRDARATPLRATATSDNTKHSCFKFNKAHIGRLLSLAQRALVYRQPHEQTRLYGVASIGLLSGKGDQVAK